jgi:hypothetical protein
LPRSGAKGCAQRGVGDVGTEAVETDLAGLEQKLGPSEQPAPIIDNANAQKQGGLPVTVRPNPKVREEGDAWRQERRGTAIGCEANRIVRRAHKGHIHIEGGKGEGSGKAARARSDNRNLGSPLSRHRADSPGRL